MIHYGACLGKEWDGTERVEGEPVEERSHTVLSCHVYELHAMSPTTRMLEHVTQPVENVRRLVGRASYSSLDR